MNPDILLYILGVMILWDFSLHVLELLGWDWKLLNSKSIFSYYYAHFRYKKTSEGPVERKDWRKGYQRFWVTFWFIALLLLVVYLLINE